MIYTSILKNSTQEIIHDKIKCKIATLRKFKNETLQSQQKPIFKRKYLCFLNNTNALFISENKTLSAKMTN